MATMTLYTANLSLQLKTKDLHTFKKLLSWLSVQKREGAQAFAKIISV